MANVTFPEAFRKITTCRRTAGGAVASTVLNKYLSKLAQVKAMKPANSAVARRELRIRGLGLGGRK